MVGLRIGACLCATAMLAIVGGSPLASASTTARPELVKITGTSLAAALAERGAAASPAMARTERVFTALKSLIGASPRAINCYNNAAIQSDENSAFVSEEQNYPGATAHMLRARAVTVGPWELYTVCRDQSSAQTLILSQEDGLYVSEEQNYPGANRFMLRARASSAGQFELFYTDANPCNGCTVHFQSGENGAYVSEEQNYPGASRFMLRARALSVGSFETFNW